MTNDEKNEIVQEVLAALRNNAKSISALTPTSDPSGTALIEISGGNSVRLNDLKNFMTGTIADNIDTLADTKLDKSAVVQATGQNEDKVMSQKAVTNNLEEKLDKSSLKQLAGNDAYNAMSQKAVTVALGLKLDKSAVVQSTGSAEDKVMSQKAVTQCLMDAGSYLTIEWIDDVASTRLQINSSARKPGMIVSYIHPSFGRVIEQFNGSDTSDSNWSADLYWMPIADTRHFTPSKNLLDGIRWIQGQSTTGSFGDSVAEADGFSVSPLIPVLPSKTYTITQSAHSTARSLLIYDKDLTLLANNNYGFNVASKTFTLPDNAAYIRLAALDTDISDNKVQLEYGDKGSEIPDKGETVQESLSSCARVEDDDDNILTRQWNKGEVRISGVYDKDNDTFTLNNNGWALAPFRVTPGDTLYAFRCREVNYNKDYLLWFFSYNDDYTTPEQFISGAVYVAKSNGCNGAFVVPEGATHAVVFRLLNNTHVHFDEQTTAQAVLLVNSDNPRIRTSRSAVDALVREQLASDIDRLRNLNTYAIENWDGGRNCRSLIHHENGFFTKDSGYDLWVRSKNPSRELVAFGAKASLSIPAGRGFGKHGNDNNRNIGFAISPVAARDICGIEMEHNYYDYLGEAGLLVKYSGEKENLENLGMGLSGYNIMQSQKKIKQLAPNIYQVCVNADLRTAISSLPEIVYGRELDENTSTNGANTLYLYVPQDMEIEVALPYLWVAVNKSEFYSFLDYKNDPIFQYRRVTDDAETIATMPNAESDLSYLKALYGDLAGKKIVWLGTSVPATGYPDIVGALTKSLVVNKSIGGTVAAYDPSDNVYGLSMTAAEESAAGSQVGLSRSFENLLDGNWDADLFVFDHLHNDEGNLSPLIGNPDYWDSETSTFKLTAENKFDRKWGIGGLNYVIREIYKRNPRAKFAIINDWRAEMFSNKLAARVVADMWAIPICELRMCNANINITTDSDILLKRWNRQADLKLLAGSNANPNQYQSASAPDNANTQTDKVIETLFNGGPDSIHPGNHGKVMYAKQVAKFLVMNTTLAGDELDLFGIIE